MSETEMQMSAGVAIWLLGLVFIILGGFAVACLVAINNKIQFVKIGEIDLDDFAPYWAGAVCVCLIWSMFNVLAALVF